MILTFGIALILLYWKPEWHLYLTCSISNLDTCDRILIKDSHKRYFVEKIQIENDLNLPENIGNIQSDSNHRYLRYFKFQMVRYCWHKEQNIYIKIQYLIQILLI